MSLPKCRTGKFYTTWASIGEGREEHVPHFSASRGQHRKCPPTFSVDKTNVHAYSETDHSPLLKTLHRSSSKINIRVITVTTKCNNISVVDGLHRPQ